MRRLATPVLCLILILGLADVSQAHFGLILPDKSMVMQGDNPNLELTVAFCHPFEQNGMDMAKPRKFGVRAGKENTDLLNTLQETKVLDKEAWKTTYTLKKPGIYAFYFDPPPYWEPAENKYIIHQTKTYVAAFGAEEGLGRGSGPESRDRAFDQALRSLCRQRLPRDAEIQGQARGQRRCGSGILEPRQEGDGAQRRFLPPGGQDR